MVEGVHVIALALSIAGFLIATMLAVIGRLIEKRISKLETLAESTSKTAGSVAAAYQVHDVRIGHLESDARGTLRRDVFEESQRGQLDALSRIEVKVDELERRKASIPIARAGDSPSPQIPPRPRLPSRPR